MSARCRTHIVYSRRWHIRRRRRHIPHTTSCRFGYERHVRADPSLLTISPPALRSSGRSAEPYDVVTIPAAEVANAASAPVTAAKPNRSDNKTSAAAPVFKQISNCFHGLFSLNPVTMLRIVFYRAWATNSSGREYFFPWKLRMIWLKQPSRRFPRQRSKIWYR